MPATSTGRLQQFFKWLSAEEGVPDLMAGLRPPKVTTGLVPVFTGTELARLERACAGRGFAERRDAAIIAVLRASGIRLSELAGIRCDPQDPLRSDIDVWQREITGAGKGGRPRIVKIDYDAARAVDRYLRAGARHPQAGRAQLWLGAGGRGPLTASGIYQAVTRRGRQCGIDVWPHRFRHHFSHTSLMPGFRFATCRKPHPMPTRAPRCDTTERGPAWTGMRPASSPPTSPEQRGSSAQIPETGLAASGGQTDRAPDLRRIDYRS